MAQPVLCAGVGQGSDYVEAEPWGAAFLPSPFPIYLQRVLSTPRFREYPHALFSHVPAFPAFSLGVVDSRHVSICISGIFPALPLACAL